MLVQKATLTPVVLLLIVWVAAPDIGYICSPAPLSCCQGGRPLLIVLSRSQCFYLAPAVGSAAPDGVFFWNATNSPAVLLMLSGWPLLLSETTGWPAYPSAAADAVPILPPAIGAYGHFRSCYPAHTVINSFCQGGSPAVRE
mmetsp:Transcript_25034/g.73276  ORF Transcript_25034/g.73276 Transcript_25034/m.73276 type:complete len:142 (-) Transcript_25034:693-1118(-)